MGFDVTYTCDVCGREIKNRDDVVEIKWHPRSSVGRWEEWHAHYKCAKPIRQAIKEVVNE